jgi:hypothetical protein
MYRWKLPFVGDTCVFEKIRICMNEQTGKKYCQTQDRNHRHLPYPLWHIITKGNNDYLPHLLKIGFGYK